MSHKQEPPEKLGDWVRSSSVRQVNAGNIFDYMDGAGELYLAYSFVGLEVWVYRTPEKPEILLEIYELRDAEDAYGVLSFDLNGSEVGVGHKSVYAAGLLRFWQGVYFVRILSEAETPAAKAAVLDLGDSVASQLPPQRVMPELVTRLPQAGLLPETVHYFHKKICLDYFYYLADDNILNLGEETDAVLADYESSFGPAKLLVLKYANETSSEQAWKQFHRVYLTQEPPADAGIHATKIEDEQWVCSRREGRFLFLVFEGKRREGCEELLREASSRLTSGG
jgi:hypothetical protein